MASLAQEFSSCARLILYLDRAMPDPKLVMQKRIDPAYQFRSAFIIGVIDTNMTGERDLL